MRSTLLALSLIAALAAFAPEATPAPRVEAGPACNADGSIDAQEQRFLQLINSHRASHGLNQLVLSSTLNRAAAWKSQHMATHSYFAHDDQGLNRTFVERLRDCGYTANTWLAENIAAGNSGAEATFAQWRNSSSHNSNMLNPNMVAIGIGRAFSSNSEFGWYWTTEFGGVADGYNAPPPASLPQQSGDVDCNGSTNSIDALHVLQYSAGLIGSLPCAGNADMDGNGRIDAIDASIILQLAAGMFG